MNALSHLVGQIQARWRGEESDEFPAFADTTTTTTTAAHAVTPLERNKPRLLRMPKRDKCIFVFTARLNSDLTEAAEHLKAGSAVLLNLQNVNSDRGQRIVDLMYGVCLGLDGQCQQVGEKLFIFAPTDYAITTEEEVDAARLASDGFMIRERSHAPSRLIEDDELTTTSRGQMRFG